jgi:hypothetical protein
MFFSRAPYGYLVYINFRSYRSVNSGWQAKRENNIKMNLGKIWLEAVDWIHLA